MKNLNHSVLLGLLMACMPLSAQATSMDVSNLEGINAGKSANGKTSADPNSYFDDYTSDVPQRDWYEGPTHTSTNIDLQGQKELSESELGQIANESYVNNPADKLSYDSDMMKYSDEIRENANAITGVNGNQCVAQELNKTTYTIHHCEMARSLTQTCKRKASIVTTGSREEYSTQLKLDARSITGKKGDGYWIIYDFVVPENGTISSGTWELLYPRAPDWHGDRLWYSIRAFGQQFRTKLNNTGVINIPTQQVTQGQIITLQLHYDTDGYHESSRDSLMKLVADGTTVFRMSFPMQSVRDTVKTELQWTSSCPTDMQDAVKMSEACTDPGGTRSVTVGGKAYNVYSDCWEYTTKWNVYEDDTNTCQAYIDNPNCSEGTRTCTQKIGNFCVNGKLTYQCAHTVKSTGYICGSEFYCSDGSCLAMQAGQNQNFEAAVSQLAALAAAGKDFAGMDPNSVSAFTGTAMACRKSAAGFSNYCKSGGWGQDAGLAHCNSEEKAIGTGKEKKLVVKVGSYCSKKVLGVCLQKKEGYCVFDSKLARIVQEQGRRDQLGVGFGSGSSPNCRGIKIAELQGIKFDHIDFSDFYDDLNSNITLPDQDALNQRITSDIQNSLKSGE
ncbi:conjugal transfer protein TraN [Mixta intestinalis]|uniref:Type-F conjugative transfer system mating-pair stabilization protein TraN n=1 Tax=Mixta intestinalis TaxID=1615494 RepID=A0A6P1Q6F8_9GAMM|nr:conjugal transfer protein TraN [Mixta intestinalis]QHM74021.1 hypothetical protein C7M51_04382 [Mixta intestinalis]